MPASLKVLCVSGLRVVRDLLLRCLCLQELFLQELAVRSHAAMAADSSRKGLEYKDVGAWFGLRVWGVGCVAAPLSFCSCCMR